MLSNLYLDTFDRRMLEAGFRVIRYGDDFVIPVASRIDGERALQTAGTELEDLRLELNSGKCHVASFDDGVRFLGETVTVSTLNAGESTSHPLETVVARVLEDKAEPVFHPDSYGYRPGRSAIDAVAQCPDAAGRRTGSLTWTFLPSSTVFGGTWSSKRSPPH